MSRALKFALALLAVGFLCLHQGHTQVPMTGAGKGTPAASYVGPGDVVGSATAWWGFRAYSLAKAGNKAARLVRASDSTQQDINTLANGNFDTASATTFCTSTTCKIVTMYDQTGGTSCTTACDATQGTDANRPAYTASALSSKPCMTLTGASGTKLTAPSLAATTTQPFTHSGVVERTSAFTSFNIILNTSGSSSASSTFNNTANTLSMFAGTVSPTIAGADSAFHAAQFIFNGASSTINVDGSSATGNPSNHASSAVLTIGTDGSNPMTGLICEFGLWPAGFSGSGITSMNSNQHTYWGF